MEICDDICFEEFAIIVLKTAGYDYDAAKVYLAGEARGATTGTIGGGKAALEAHMEAQTSQMRQELTAELEQRHMLQKRLEVIALTYRRHVSCDIHHLSSVWGLD